MNKGNAKKYVPTPVVVIDESEQLASTVVVSKLIGSTYLPQKDKPTFAGGFKQKNPNQLNEQVAGNSCIQNSKQLALPKVDQQTVYDQFGIVNQSIAKSKYRPLQDAPQMYRNTSQMAELPHKIQKSQMASYKVNEYQMANTNNREQTAVHVQSSLDVIDLESIEAKLQAHRLAMLPIQQEYHRAKGTPLMHSIDNQVPKSKFNIDVDSDLKKTQGASQVYELIKSKQERQMKDPYEVKMEEMWEKRKKADPKLSQYDFKYQQYLVEKEAKSIVGKVMHNSLYTWDKYALKEDIDKRKEAKLHKSKEKQYLKQKKDGEKSPSKDEKNDSRVQVVPVQSIEQVLATKNDKFLAQFITAEIDVSKRGLVSKEELAEYILAKEHIVKAYHIDRRWLYTDLDNFNTKRRGLLEKEEIAIFLATLDRLHHPEMNLVEANKSSTNGVGVESTHKIYTSNFKECLPLFESVFNAIDAKDDRIVKREELIESIYSDADCMSILDSIVLHILIIDKPISYRQILTCVLDDYRKQKNEKLRKSKEYITFERFKEYFEVPESLDLQLLDHNKQDRLKKNRESVEHEIYDIEEGHLALLKDIFDTIPRIYQQYIVANDFVTIASKDPQALAINEELCRIQSTETSLPVENIRSTLARMRKECDQYATWDVAKLYFSRRGRPLDWDYELIKTKKQIREKKLKSTANLVKQATKFVRNSIEYVDHKAWSRKKSLDKYTVPKPFNITDERKKEEEDAKRLMSTEMRELEEMKKQFKAKLVNREVLEPKPDLIMGRKTKPTQKMYNYEDYQSDRIKRTLERAQQAANLQQKMREIKQLTEVKAKDVSIDLKTKLDDVMKDLKKKVEKSKPKPTVPKIGSNLYPDNPKEDHQRKIQKALKNIEKVEEAEKAKGEKLKQISNKAKEHNTQIGDLAKEKQKEEEQRKKRIKAAEGNKFRPTIASHTISEEEKEAMIKAKEERQRKKLETQQRIMEAQSERRKKLLAFEKKQKKVNIKGLSNSEILDQLLEIDFQDLLLDEIDKKEFRKEYNFREKTRKEIKEFHMGLAGRERAAIEAEDKRITESKRKEKEQAKGRFVKQKIAQTKQKNSKNSGGLDQDINFHKSNALRRYRQLMAGNKPDSQYDKYSTAGLQSL